MTDYANWEFMLNGDTQEFRQLSERPSTGYFNIYGGIDFINDCPNDDFRMSTMYCEGEVDSEIVWQIGYELISIFNGMSILFNSDYRKISFFGLLHNGVKLAYAPKRDCLALMGRPAFTLAILRAELGKAKLASIKLHLLHLATENQDVWTIFKYFDMEPGWVTYYKLLEAIESFAEIKKIDFKVDESRRRSFTNTANNFSLSGFDSRHGFKEVVKLNKTPAMTVTEGYDFVAELAREYIKKAYSASGSKIGTQG